MSFCFVLYINHLHGTSTGPVALWPNGLLEGALVTDISITCTEAMKRQSVSIQGIRIDVVFMLL